MPAAAHCFAKGDNTVLGVCGSQTWAPRSAGGWRRLTESVPDQCVSLGSARASARDACARQVRQRRLHRDQLNEAAIEPVETFLEGRVAARIAVTSTTGQ